jgi:hypothetical protein
MFVVDRVELVIVDQVEKMRELHGYDAALCEKAPHAIDEIPDIGNVSQYIVANNQVGAAFLLAHALGRRNTEECYFGLNPLSLSSRGRIRSRLDAKHGNAGVCEVLQKVAVVAGEFDDKTRLVDAVIGLHVLAVASRMLDPAIRVRRKVRVLIGEDLVGCNVLVELHEVAPIAHIGM